MDSSANDDSLAVSHRPEERKADVWDCTAWRRGNPASFGNERRTRAILSNGPGAGAVGRLFRARRRRCEFGRRDARHRGARGRPTVQCGAWIRVHHRRAQRTRRVDHGWEHFEGGRRVRPPAHQEPDHAGAHRYGSIRLCAALGRRGGGICSGAGLRTGARQLLLHLRALAAARAHSSRRPESFGADHFPCGHGGRRGARLPRPAGGRHVDGGNDGQTLQPDRRFAHHRRGNVCR